MDTVAGKDRRSLELASDPGQRDLMFGHLRQIQAITEKYRAAVRSGFAGNHVHQGGFPGAVGADDAAQFAGIKIQGQIVQSFEAVEADGELFDVQNHAV